MAIYLDHNATSPPTPQHLSMVLTKITAASGNPSSPHQQGRATSVALTQARRWIADHTGFDISEIVFVSGATEANNIGTIGILNNISNTDTKPHVITSASEHPSILEPLEFLERQSKIELTRLLPEQDGLIKVPTVIAAIRPHTKLISIMAANNETGALFDTKTLGAWLHQARWHKNNPELEKYNEFLNSEVTPLQLQHLHFHVDGVQAFGKIHTSLWLSLGVDSVSICPHKIGGLSGIGALALRKGRKYLPLQWGGNQEKKRRPGTENIIGILSFGIVAEMLCHNSWWDEVNKRAHWRQRFINALDSFKSFVTLNSPEHEALWNTVNFSVCSNKLNGEDVLMELDLQGIYTSSGSACSSGTNLPSRALLALGRTPKQASNAVRISVGVNTDINEIDKTCLVLQTILQKGM